MIMATLKIKIDTGNNRAKALLNYLLSLSKDDKSIQIEWIEKKNEFNDDTVESVEDAKNGKTTKYKDSKELFKKLGI
jgi:hypothetical protein